ncbi:hypothetical protein KMZ29_02595 [Bradyrhizobium sediminis]|uniref:Uncharacterized protein n=1 Tax=Bradyrhizobium sediminis TaxID=2840469 RepID=A0A975NF17_9BRAD|nr:hypothetical protein [Bradyrhizobium sediminis]QWG13645.1 hypothetical protein KMZ29_02595 [Bradyrhizobium sediminis]
MAREQEARDAASSVTRRASDLGRALATAPASEAANIEHELTRLRARQSELAAKHRNQADLIAAITHWLSSATGTLETVKPAKAALQKGETISAAVVRLRARIHALTTERVKVMQAGVPIADLKAQAAAYVDALVDRGRPRIIADHRRDFEVQFRVGETWSDAGLAGRLPAILAWLDPDQFLAKLNQTIDAMPTPPFAMSGKARAQKLIALEASLLQCEREEEALIESSEETGPVILRRLTADPRAVLCLGINRGQAAKQEGKVERVKADDAA